jgi:hypothetical protein
MPSTSYPLGVTFTAPPQMVFRDYPVVSPHPPLTILYQIALISSLFGTSPGVGANCV